MLLLQNLASDIVGLPEAWLEVKLERKMPKGWLDTAMLGCIWWLMVQGWASEAAPFQPHGRVATAVPSAAAAEIPDGNRGWGQEAARAVNVGWGSEVSAIARPQQNGWGLAAHELSGSACQHEGSCSAVIAKRHADVMLPKPLLSAASSHKLSKAEHSALREKRKSKRRLQNRCLPFIMNS